MSYENNDHNNTGYNTKHTWIVAIEHYYYRQNWAISSEHYCYSLNWIKASLDLNDGWLDVYKETWTCLHLYHPRNWGGTGNCFFIVRNQFNLLSQMSVMDMTGQLKELGHQQPWYWRSYFGISRFQFHRVDAIHFNCKSTFLQWCLGVQKPSNSA